MPPEVTKWKPPPKIKVYEALGALADDRVELTNAGAYVFSSARKRRYQIDYDSDTGSLASNDNGSYWQRYFGYPVIAFLLGKGLVRYDASFLPYLTGFSWGSLNVRFKRNYPHLESYLDSELGKRGLKDIDAFHRHVRSIIRDLESLDLSWVRSSEPPPK